MSEENTRPPLCNQSRRRSSSSKNRSWRQDDTKDKKKLEKGIDASSFHQSKNARARPVKIRQALKDASTSVVKQKRREVTTSLKLQRAAFKEVTSLKTWPLQEMGVQDFDHWMKIHYGEDEDSTTQQQQQDPDAAETHGDSTGLSSSSLDEPKRTRRQQKDDDLSPRKSTMRHQFQQEFLRERALERKSPPELFQTALWCMEPRIFSVEKSATGKRRYMVGALGRFLDYYWRKCDPKHRHYYELIREKAPCRLYFDLEFSKAANPDITQEDSIQLLEEFIMELSSEFERIYDIDLHRSCIVDLDSSTEKKFSRHLIVHLPNKALFADTMAAGRFVRVLVGRLAEEAATGQLQESRPTLARHLFVNTKPKQSDSPDSVSTPDSTCPSPSSKDTACFVDMGVYTRNRLLRLLGSAKYGKPSSAALRISESNTFPFPQGFTNDSFYVPAMEERVKEKRDELWDDDEIDMDAEIAKFQSAVDWTNHATALGETLVVPVNASKLDLPILHESDEAMALIVDTPGSSDGKLTNDGAPRTQILSSTSLQHGHSPFPSVDDYIVNQVGCRGGVQGAIRAWSIENDVKNGLPQFITYQMSRNRYCERLKRPHRSNNIMWTVDLQAMQCTQACHDPDCRALRFRGTPVDLPPEVREAVADALFEQQLATMDEKELLTSAPTMKNDDKEATTTSTSFDEAEFERALMSLNINGDESDAKAEKPDDDDQNQDAPSKEEESPSDATDEASAAPKPSSSPPPPMDDLDDPLSDEALLAAMKSNPDLFP